MFDLGTEKIGSQLEKIREALIVTKNIVPEENEETFHEQIRKAISDKMIKALNQYCKIAKKNTFVSAKVTAG